jgi:hypothetical protein
MGGGGLWKLGLTSSFEMIIPQAEALQAQRYLPKCLNAFSDYSLPCLQYGT